MVDLVTFSKLIGVSTGTISRVLNNHPSQRVSEDKRHFIMSEARKYGYRPNSAARSLAIQKTLNVALVHHFGTSIENFVNPNIAMPVMMALEKVLKENHYGLNLVFITREKPEVTFSQLVQNYRTFDAVVFPTRVATKGIIDFTVEYQIPCAVILDPRAVEWNANSYCSDEEEDVRIAIKHLMALGHREIGVVGWDEAGRLKKGTFTFSFAEFIAQSGLKSSDEWIISVKQNRDVFYSRRDHGREAMRQILSLPKRPTAIVTQNDMIALGLSDIMQENHMQPGREISIIGHGNFEEMAVGSNSQPFLTTLEPPIFEIGRAAAEALLAQINDNTLPHQHILYPSQLIVRNSTCSLS
jgi:LacI family transcriptional regulator